jgi:hypothetical protein
MELISVSWACKITFPINGSHPLDYPRRWASSRGHCIGWFCLPIPAVEVEPDRDTCVPQLSDAGWRDLKVAAPISEYSEKHGHAATGIRNHSHPITGLGRQTLNKVDQER